MAEVKKSNDKSINLEKKENTKIDIIIKHFDITKSEFNDFK